MIVDSHHHVWTQSQYRAIYEAYGSPPVLRPLLRDYSPQDMKPILDELGIDRTVLIQIETTAEHNQVLLNYAREHEWIGAVIGWADLQDPQLPEHLDQLAQYAKFKGIRDPLELKPTPEWILQADVLNGLHELAQRNFIFELLIDSSHWEVIPRLAEAVPNLKLVINHFGKPNVGSIDDWTQMLLQIMPLEQVMMKLSGIMVLMPQSDWKNWSTERFQPFVDRLLDMLGAERLMIATDWPVSTLIGTYEQVFEAVKCCIAHLSDDSQTKILGGNAQQLYSIQ